MMDFINNPHLNGFDIIYLLEDALPVTGDLWLDFLEKET